MLDAYTTCLFVQLLWLLSCSNGDQNNRTKYIFFNLRKIYNRNKWKNYVIAARVKFRVELDVLVMREQPILKKTAKFPDPGSFVLRDWCKLHPLSNLWSYLGQ